MTTFPGRLRDLMAARGLGVLAVARAAHVDRAYVSRVASGRQTPSPQLARSLDHILDGDGQLAALARPDTGRAAPDEVRETSRSLISLERRLGGDAVLPAAVQAFRTATRMAVDNHDRLAAAAEAGEIGAWIAYDAEQPRVSRTLAAEALTLSRDAGDREMELFLASHLMMLDVEQGRPEVAVRVSTSILEGRLPPRARAVFLIRRGRGLVRLGDTRGGLTDLRRARMLTGRRPRLVNPLTYQGVRELVDFGLTVWAHGICATTTAASWITGRWRRCGYGPTPGTNT